MNEKSATWTLAGFSGPYHFPVLFLELTKDELGIINNALNEVCNGIDLEGEFDTRMGCNVEEARAVLAKVHALAAGQ